MFNATTWHNGEALAKKYLKKRGYKIIATNDHLAGVEVDILAIEPRHKIIGRLKKDLKYGKINRQAYLAAKNDATNTIVVVEVKSFASDKFGSPAQMITTEKQSRLIKYACALKAKKEYKNMPIRYDVIAVTGESIDHFIEAF